MALDTLFRGEPFEHHAATTDTDLDNLYHGLPEQFYGAGGGGGDVTLALTGVVTNGQLGVATMQSTAPELALYGNASTAAVGTLVPVHTTAITGNGITASVGSVLLGTPIALTGVASTASVGVVIRTIPLDLGGLAITTATGALAAQRSVGVPGIHSDTASGLISGSDGEKRVAGQESLTDAGSLGLLSTNSVAGNSAALAVGSALSALAAGAQSVAGSGQSGNVALQRSAALTGDQIASANGSVAVSRSIALTGLESASAVGFIRLTGLTGVAATGTAGNVLMGDGTTGNELTATIGVATVSVSLTIGGVQSSGAAGRFISQRQPGRDPTMATTTQIQIQISGV